MSEILSIGQTVRTQSSGITCTVEKFLGGGGQGEVYQASLGNQKIALKWYFPHYLQYEIQQRERLETAIGFGAPSEKFLWPMELASAPDVPSFGYIMQLREPRYTSFVDLIKRRVEPSFAALTTAGFQLADSFFQLHAKGLCYRDISFGNVFFDPNTGDILICDNDNVSVDGEGKSGILGTPRFMAPEIVRGEALPNAQTDLYSLSVLLFYMFVLHHPLEGQKEAQIRCLDLPAQNKLYGSEPVFIFDPQDNSNRPVPGYQDNALSFWPIYPQFLRDLFIKAFTNGIREPESGRVAESVWRSAMIRLHDSIVYCPECAVENFYDSDVLKATGGKLKPCWACGMSLPLPPRIRIGRHVVMLNYNTQLFPHHVDPQRLYDFSRPVAAVNQNSKDPKIWGLKNCSDQKWAIATANGSIREVEPGRNVTLAVGTKINFGSAEGEIRL